MTTDPRLEILPQFQIRGISLGPETALVTGTFSRAEGIAIDHRGWLFHEKARWNQEEFSGVLPS